MIVDMIPKKFPFEELPSGLKRANKSMRPRPLTLTTGKRQTLTADNGQLTV